jgi:HK97 family phage portal protein
MSFLDNLKSFGTELRDFFGGTISWPMDLIGGGLWGGIAPATSGAVVTEYTALQVGAYYACVRIISDQIASLPLLVMERQADGSEIPAWNHPLMKLFHTTPNSESTSSDFRQAGQGHLLLNGNCYIQIAWNGAGMPGALYLRSPFRTFPFRDRKTGDLIYKTTDNIDGQETKLDSEDVIHVKGFSFDGLVGLSPVKVYAREVLGCDLAAQNYGAKFFANDSRPGGYLKNTARMKDAEKLNAATTWNLAHSQGNAHRMAILDGGLTWEGVGVAPEEAQFIQTRSFNRSQIAAIFGVPGHMVGDDADAPRAVLEQKGVEFLSYTIKPWAKRWEQAINAKVFPTGKYFVKFDTTELERPTYDVLLKGIQMARYAGLMSANEGRKLLKLNPRIKSDYESENPADALWIPVNMVPVKAEEPEPEPTPAAPESQGGVGGADQQPGVMKANSKVFASTFADAVNRITARGKPTERDFDRCFMPVLAAIAMSTRSEDVIPGAFVEFLHGYVKGIAHRFATGTFAPVGDELDRAVREINGKSPEIDPEDGDAEEKEEEETNE